MGLNIVKVGEYRSARARKDLKEWLKKVGLPYHSAHKFRHGHAVYGIKNSKDLGDLKAVSMNLMHSNLSITDGVYGVLSNDDVEQRITNSGLKNSHEKLDKQELINRLEIIIDSLRHQ